MTNLNGTMTVGQLRRSALLRGLASIMDLRGDTRRQYCEAATPAAADTAALWDDWSMVGADLTEAMRSARPSS